MKLYLLIGLDNSGCWFTLDSYSSDVLSIHTDRDKALKDAADRCKFENPWEHNSIAVIEVESEVNYSPTLVEQFSIPPDENEDTMDFI